MKPLETLYNDALGDFFLKKPPLQRLLKNAASGAPLYVICGL
jgi:hypothetical protein